MREMKKETKPMLLLAAIIGILVLLAACAAPAAEEPVEEEPAAEDDASDEEMEEDGEEVAEGDVECEFPDEVVVGMTAALSGPWAGFGQKPATGLEIAAEHINENGGIQALDGAEVRIVLGDDQAVPERALAEAERLITQEEVVAMMGIWPTETPISSQAERFAVPTVFPLGVAAVHERGYSYVFKNYATGMAEAEQQLGAILQAAEDNGLPPPATVYMEYISDDASITNAAGMRELFEENGIEIVGDEVVEPGQPSYATLLAKIEEAQPDLLYSSHYAPGAITIYTEIAERELYFPYGIIGWGGGAEDILFYEQTPPEAFAYMWVQENGDPLPWRRPWYDYINDRVEEKLDISWTDSHFVSPYTAMWQLKDALERATWDCDLETYRDNVRVAISETDITPENAEEIPIPDTDLTFQPALDPFGFDFVRYDETGLNEFQPGMVSQNLGGVRWPMYPESFMETDGPSQAILPIPTWDERADSPPLVTSEEELQELLESNPDWLE